MIKRTDFDTAEEFFCTDMQSPYLIYEIGYRANAPIQTNAKGVSPCFSVKKIPSSARKLFCFRNVLFVRARLLLGVFVIGFPLSILFSS